MVYAFGPFRLDAQERRLHRDQRVVAVTPKAFDTLLVLVANAGRAVGKDEQGGMSMSNMMADRDEDFNTRYASYRGWQMAWACSSSRLPRRTSGGAACGRRPRR